MRDLAFIGFLVALFGMGFKRPFLFVLAYVYIDIVSPQRLTYFLLNAVPISLIAVALAFGGWALADDKRDSRFAPRQALILLLLLYCGITTIQADFPIEALEKWDWVWKSLIFAAFLPLTLRTRLRIEALLLFMILSAASIIIVGGIKTLASGGGYGQLNLMVSTNSGLYEGSIISAVAIAIIPLILWFARHGTIFPPDWRVKTFCYALVFACLLIPVGTSARTGLICIGLLAILMLRDVKRRILYLAALGLAGAVAVPLLPSAFTDRMETIKTYQGDESASTRIAVWKWTWEYVQDHPWGGGFEAYRQNNIRYDTVKLEGADGNTKVDAKLTIDKSRAYHSSYFEMLGEQGFAGLGLWLLINLGGLLRMEILRRRYPDADGEFAWAGRLAGGLQHAHLIYLVGGAFVGIALNPFLFQLLAAQIGLDTYLARLRAAGGDAANAATARRERLSPTIAGLLTVAGLFIIRDTGLPACGQALARASADFARQGFGEPTVLSLPGWRALHWSPIEGGSDTLLPDTLLPDTLLIDGEDLVAVAGTLLVDGLMGRPALAALLAATHGPIPDWSRIGGQFVALVRRAGRTFLFTDWFAAFQLFHDADRQLFSTALLAAVGALPRVRFDTQGLYEFAFNVTPLGDDTVFEGLSTLGPNVALELTPTGTIAHPLAKPLPTAPRSMPIGERIERHRARLDAIIGPHVRHYGDRIFCPLSGGLDSRLLLACLRRMGADPDVYVYGPGGSIDVDIALAIGTKMGFNVDWIDKASMVAEPDAFPDLVERNFLAFDGLPNFGNIFDTGGNIAARDARHAGGALAGSGGCGEIYRNFFYLSDRPTSAEAVARTFFARFLASDATDLFDPRAYIERVTAKILDALGLPDHRGPLPRTVVEQIYPRVRCRALFGREISMENRLSPYLMPFLDHQVVAEAMTLPMALRSAGRFEAALLNAIDPALAALPSAYGHDFAGRPGRGHRFSEWSARMRPIWLRQRSYAIRRRLRPMGDEHGGMLDAAYLDRVVDLDFPAMRRYFHVDRITDSGLLRRIACLEYLARHLGSRLVA